MNDTPFAVFFGSSTENIPIMEKVASWIDSPTTKLFLWNTLEAFPAGRYTFESLLKLTHICQAAVFVFGEDDKVSRRGSERYQPRDNVLLECGIFASRLGITNTLICRMPESQLPSDLLGITIINLNRTSFLDAKERVTSWFSQLRQDASPREPTGSPPPNLEPSARHQQAEQRPECIVSREQLYKFDKRMSGEVFAVELLTQPVKIERKKSGEVTVTLDRSGVSDMLICNAGKDAITRKCVTPQNTGRLLELDREVQDFLAEGGPGSKIINLEKEGIVLRWASGGILSIVTDASGKQWVPLFFRDIRPYGWNIALGTSERWFTADNRVDQSHLLEADLIDPRQYIQREFLEESLIVSGIPQRGGTLSMKEFNFSHAALTIPIHRAKHFDDEHCRLRQERDEWIINLAEGNQAKVKLRDAGCSLTVLSGVRGNFFETKNVLICFSLLDLGIEVAQVAAYNLDADDWMLDGEIQERYNAETGEITKELVRMPIALMSLDYLRQTFGKSQDWQRYTFGTQPSIEVTEGPDPKKGEIRLFCWDVKRRMEAIEGKWDAGPMRKRFFDWYDMFRGNFIEQLPGHRWQVSAANPSRLFVPGTAKIINLYFRLGGG